MPRMIRQGDSTSHGGTVLEGFPHYKVEGRAAAGLGHQVRCPKCRGTFPIAEGNPTHTYNQVPLAYHGMKTACGATLVATQASTTHTLPTGGPVRIAEEKLPHNPLAGQPEDKLVQFLIRHHETREPLAGVPYVIRLSSGAQESGYSDSQGLTRQLKVKKTIQAELLVQGAP